MIHFIKEGNHLKIGLNISVGRKGWLPWITALWCWYDVATKRLLIKRVRIRTHLRPFIITQDHSVDVIESYMQMHDLVACPKELLEDFAPKLIPLAGYFYQQFRSGKIERYNG